MTTKIRKIGNSSGIIISKAMLNQLNIEPKDELELFIEGDKICIRKVKSPREGWEEAFQQMHKNGDDQLLIDDVFEDENFEEWI